MCAPRTEDPVEGHRSPGTYPLLCLCSAAGGRIRKPERRESVRSASGVRSSIANANRQKALEIMDIVLHQHLTPLNPLGIEPEHKQNRIPEALRALYSCGLGSLT